jgi:hypothetical protein
MIKQVPPKIEDFEECFDKGSFLSRRISRPHPESLGFTDTGIDIGGLQLYRGEDGRRVLFNENNGEGGFWVRAYRIRKEGVLEK